MTSAVYSWLKAIIKIDVDKIMGTKNSDNRTSTHILYL